MVVGRFHRQRELIEIDDSHFDTIRNLQVLLQLFNYLCEFTNTAAFAGGCSHAIERENEGQSDRGERDRNWYSGVPAHIVLRPRYCEMWSRSSTETRSGRGFQKI